MLGGCKLSLLNQLAAPMIAGSARLFVSADLASSSSSGGSSEPGRPQLLPLLSAARHIQAVCTKGPAAASGISTASATAGAHWLPCQQFISQLEQRRQAEQQRRAEAAALAAAEADRRERLRQAARQRQHGQQQEPQRAAVQQPQEQQQQPRVAGEYQSAAYGSPSKAWQAATEAAPQPQPAAAGSDLPGGDAGPDGSSSLQQLRQQFQALYQQTVGDAGAATPPQRPSGGSNNGSPRWAAGVAAADDVAMHVAALRMQAAAEAQRELLGLAADGCGASGAADFSWSPHSDGGHSRAGSGQPGSGSLGRQLEEELLLLQQEAAAGRAAGRAAESPVASLADLDGEQGEAYSLGALYRKQPLSRTGFGAGSASLQQRHEQEQQEQWQAPACSAAEGTPQSSLGAAGRWPAEPAAAAPASVGASPELSDVFKSENMPRWSPAGAAAAGARSTASCSRPPSAGSSQQQQLSGGGSYAAMQRRRPQPLASAAVPGVSTAGSSPPGSQQLELLSPSANALVPGAAAGQPPAPHMWQHQSVASAAAELDGADVAGLLEDLQREQRLNAALLQQLHGVQQQLEEAAAAAAAVAAAQPPAPGVEDPADFNGLLAGV